MADSDEQHPWSDADAGAGGLSEVERRLAPLRTTAGVASVLAAFLLFLGAFLLSRHETTVDASLWPGVVTTGLGLVLATCAGFAVVAHHACRALLGAAPE